jgi:hypothetical protein
MLLTPDQIIKIGQDTLAAIKTAQAVIDAGVNALNAHNAVKGAKRVETGSIVVCQGAVATIVEQATRHVSDNTPAPPPAAA